jgi:isopentenyl diphosphate isomerase/L-lactate dehydrogenase-like FMN-dependent dehydrogenase
VPKKSPAAATPSSGSTVANEFVNLHEIIHKARANLNQNYWDHIVGGTETETTLWRNRLALDSIAFRPRVLRDVSKVDATTNQFGRRLRLPVALAPCGGLEVIEPGGGATCAKAAGEFGVAQMLSSACAPGLEAVAEAAPDALRIYQLYVRGDDAFVEDHVRRAIKCGYTAFCVTVDVAVYSRRERNTSKRYLAGQFRRGLFGEDYQAALDWRTIDIIKKFGIPVIIKGIATAEDAEIAVEHGVDWIYVSNHGGRELDHGRGSIEVLPEIVAAVKGRAKTIIDGSINRGSDVVKAIASGADLVSMGRMQCYGLAAAGQAGIVRMLEILEDEVQRCLALLGVNKLADLDKSYLHPAAPTHPPHVLSAFPLLKIDEYRY